MDIKVRDSNGALLAEGDTVTLIKDLKLKGSSTVLKRGTVIRNIHLTDDEDEIEGPHRQGEGPGVVHGISEEGVRAMREIVRKHPNVVPAKAGTHTPRIFDSNAALQRRF